MNSNPLHLNTSRSEGCTVTGALSVSAFVNDAVSIVHGPAGCAHLNLNLFHTTLLQQNTFRFFDITTSGMDENDVIFGGEKALKEAITAALERSPKAVFVISTCIPETIGDDILQVCAQDRGVPVIPIKSSGFLGGSFYEGYESALTALLDLAEPQERHDGGVNIVGEKNLEYEVEENFLEIKRLLSALNLDVNVRFVRDVSTDDIRNFCKGKLNVMRDDQTGNLTRYFEKTTGIPSIGSFPTGPGNTIQFLRRVGELCGVDSRDAVQEELALQEELIADFSDLRGEKITFDSFGFQNTEALIFDEVARAIGIRVDDSGTVIPVPMGMPVGTTGLRHMLSQWRRFIHA